MRRQRHDSIHLTLEAALLLLLAGTLLAGNASAQSGCLPAPEGLVAWWSGDGDARDIQGGRDATPVNGAAFGPGMVGAAFDLDGVDDYLAVADDPALRAVGEITFDLWARFDSVPRTGVQADNLALLEKGDYPFPGHGYTPTGDGGNFILYWRSDAVDHLDVHFADACDGAYHLGATFYWPELAPGVFHHIAVTAKDNGAAGASDIKLYIDGSEVAATPSVQPSHATCGWHTGVSGELRIGARTLYHLSPFDGVIDEVEIFDRVLSAAEIQAIYDAGVEGKCKDEDGDGFRPPDDCDETDPAVNPDAHELPGNFVDENCDGSLGTCDPCFPWRNHGEYVRCVAHEVESLVGTGILTEDEGDALVSSAAGSDVGKRGYTPSECAG